MEALGIIIFIVFLLLRMFSRLPDIKQKLPREWERELPPIFRDMGLPWDEQESAEQREDTPGNLYGQGPAGEAKAKREQAGRERMLPQRPAPQKPDSFGGADESGADSLAMAADMCLTNHRSLLFDEQAVLNGVIFSEVLGPPKSRRKR